MFDSTGNVTVEVVPPDCRATALGLLHLGKTQIERMLAEQRLGRCDLSGLFHARRGVRAVGAAWGQRIRGNAAFCWPPCLLPDEPEQTATTLQRAVDGFLDAAGTVITQAILPNPIDTDAHRLCQAGYRHLTDLDYMACTDEHFPVAPPVSSLLWLPIESDQGGQIASLVERTYQGSLDCPELDGLREMEDVLEGYHATGTFRPEWWLRVVHDQHEVGCLILADHPDHAQVELVYLGVVPEARGCGWGRELTRYAQWLTGRQNRTRLVLAVDQRNWPAHHGYAATGFVVWDHRSVFVRNQVTV